MSLPQACSRARWLLILAPLLAALLPWLAGAQPQPPHLFDGALADVTIDGLPYDGVSPIDVIDDTGVVVAQVGVADGVWFVQLPADAGDVRFRLGDALSPPFTVLAGDRTADIVLTMLTPQLAVTRDVQLVAGFNWLTYTGPNVDIVTLLAAFPLPDAVDAIFYFDASTQTWSAFRTLLPLNVNSLTRLAQNQPYAFAMSTAMTWSMPLAPLAPAGPSVINLPVGFSAIPWPAPDGTNGTDVAAVLARFADAAAVGVIFLFDAPTQTWLSFRTLLPPSLNSLTTVAQFDVLFVQLDAPLTFTSDPGFGTASDVGAPG